MKFCTAVITYTQIHKVHCTELPTRFGKPESEKRIALILTELWSFSFRPQTYTERTKNVPVATVAEACTSRLQRHQLLVLSVSNPCSVYTFRNYINELEFKRETSVKVHRIISDTGSFLGAKAEHEWRWGKQCSGSGAINPSAQAEFARCLYTATVLATTMSRENNEHSCPCPFSAENVIFMFHPSLQVAQNYKLLRSDSRCTSRQHDLQKPDEEEPVNH